MRPTIVEVLPVPAEAMIKLLPIGAVAAFNCSVFSLLSGMKGAYFLRYCK